MKNNITIFSAKKIGTIECGKFADFAVLDESPLDVDPMKIKDIRVWGTVVGGIKYQAVAKTWLI